MQCWSSENEVRITPESLAEPSSSPFQNMTDGWGVERKDINWYMFLVRFPLFKKLSRGGFQWIPLLSND
jgi:hypothetical protein